MGQILLGALALGLLWAVMTIGVYISYRILDIADLTVEGSITLGAAICASMIVLGYSPYIATACAFAGGLAAGLVTGFLHTKLRIPSLLSGILTMIALYSVNLRVIGRANVSLLRMNTVFSPLEALGMKKDMAVIVLGAVCVMAIISILYWFFGTELGNAVRATGNNPNMVRAQGVNTDTMKILGIVLSNGLVAFSGALIAQHQNFADIQMGTGSIVISLASLIIGEVLFGRRNYFSRLFSLILGAITYRVIIALVLKMGMPTNDLKLFTALTVILALSLPLGKETLNTLKRSIKGGRAHADATKHP